MTERENYFEFDKFERAVRRLARDNTFCFYDITFDLSNREYIAEVTDLTKRLYFYETLEQILHFFKNKHFF